MTLPPSLPNRTVGLVLVLMAAGFSGLIAVLFFPNLPDPAPPVRKANWDPTEEVEIASSVSDLRSQVASSDDTLDSTVNTTTASSDASRTGKNTLALPDCEFLQRLFRQANSKN